MNYITLKINVKETYIGVFYTIHPDFIHAVRYHTKCLENRLKQQYDQPLSIVLYYEVPDEPTTLNIMWDNKPIVSLRFSNKATRDFVASVVDPLHLFENIIEDVMFEFDRYKSMNKECVVKHRKR